jgi:hypothetical protein
MLANPGHPGATYRFVRLVGGTPEATVNVIIPTPATDNDDYILGIWNASDGVQISVGTGAGATVSMGFPLASEVTFTGAVVNEINGGNSNTIRQDVLATTTGAFQNPGYSATPPPG